VDGRGFLFASLNFVIKQFVDGQVGRTEGRYDFGGQVPCVSQHIIGYGHTPIVVLNV
tara:strand:+ start:815 stop:985 length:171 start_codon:yes stop_codon:yes gene_type:complete